MAICTALPQATFVYIVVTVTCHAGGRCLTILTTGFVTGCTFFLQVGAAKHKIALTVVKFLFVQHHNTSLASSVIGMTSSTALRFQSAVETSFGVKVSSDFLVAIFATFVLPGFVEADVTIFAVALQLGMAGGKFAGHDDRFDTLPVGQGSH